MASIFVHSVILPLLPRSLADIIRTHVIHPDSPFQIYGRQAIAGAQRGYHEIVLPRLEPLYHQAIGALSEAAGSDGPAAIIALLPLVLTGIAAVMVVSFTMRLISWWTRLLTRLAFWAVILVFLLGVWERGPLQSVRDIVVVGGKLAGYGAAVREIWVREYNHYEEQTRSSARAHHTRR